MTKRALIAMSGGVDSSCAASLLLDQGFTVEGVTLKLTAGVCCDIAGAQAVCAHLGIPHRVIDMQSEFDRVIIASFIEEYRRGRTPNPCIGCNDLIKFDRLLSYAREHRFDHLATGHYARIERDPGSSLLLLKKGLDPGKDQSYFLYRMTQEQLRSILFPLGEMRKTDVRKRAADQRLPAAEREESQEVCFVPGDDYRSFLRARAPDVLQPGELVMTDGSIVGRHRGVAFFTVGQRRKLGVSAGERLYVVRLEPDQKRVVLGRRDELAISEVRLSRMHYCSGRAPAAPFSAEVKVRYRASSIPAMVHPAAGDEAHMILGMPAEGATPGQAAVLYEGDVVLGGGIIER